MHFLRLAALANFALLALVSAAVAHQPGVDLDEMMTDREAYFQVMDRPAPDSQLANAEGEKVALSDFADKIVVLNFIYAGCLDVCPLHSELIAEIQKLTNISPMRDLVQFVTVTTDPRRDTPEVMRTYGDTHGLDPANWIFLTKLPNQDNAATRKLAGEFGLEFTETEDGQQLHGVVTIVIDRDGQFAAKFHGLRFETVNLVLYANGLINNRNAPHPEAEENWFAKILGSFWNKE